MDAKKKSMHQIVAAMSQDDFFNFCEKTLFRHGRYKDVSVMDVYKLDKGYIQHLACYQPIKRTEPVIYFVCLRLISTRTPYNPPLPDIGSCFCCY